MSGVANGPSDDDGAGDALFLFFFFVREFVLHLARDCIDYSRRFYSFCLDVFATRPHLRGTCWSPLRRLNTDNDSN